jgi:hypothetical protein
MGFLATGDSAPPCCRCSAGRSVSSRTSEVGINKFVVETFDLSLPEQVRLASTNLL